MLKSLLTRLRKYVPDQQAIVNNRWLRWLGPSLQNPKLWHISRHGVALGVALGVFFGLLIPIAQIPLSAAAAIILRANIPAAAASTLVTNPVTSGPIYYAAYQLGSAITEQPATPAANLGVVAGHNIADDSQGILEKIQAMGKPLLIGLGICATITGLLSYALVSLFWVWRDRRRKPVAA